MGVPVVLADVSPQPHSHQAFAGYRFARVHGQGDDFIGMKKAAIR